MQDLTDQQKHALRSAIARLLHACRNSAEAHTAQVAEDVTKDLRAHDIAVDRTNGGGTIIIPYAEVEVVEPAFNEYGGNGF